MLCWGPFNQWFTVLFHVHKIMFPRLMNICYIAGYCNPSTLLLFLFDSVLVLQADELQKRLSGLGSRPSKDQVASVLEELQAQVITRDSCWVLFLTHWPNCVVETWFIYLPYSRPLLCILAVCFLYLKSLVTCLSFSPIFPSHLSFCFPSHLSFLLTCEMYLSSAVLD